MAAAEGGSLVRGVGWGLTYEDELVELLHVCGDGEGRHGVEHAEWVALVEQLVRLLVVQAPGHDEDHIVDHVRDPAHLQKVVQGALRLPKKEKRRRRR